MKYKDLPSKELIKKLIATSFKSPSANLKVYKWCSKVMEHSNFVENERVKLVRKYGKENRDGDISVPKENYDAFFSEFNEVTDMEIEDKIDSCPIEDSWFEDENCSYPSDKSMWISAEEIWKLKSI